MFAIRIEEGRDPAKAGPGAEPPPGLFPHADPALQQHWQDEHAFIVSSGDPSSRAEPRLVICRESGVALTIWGRIHNRKELAAKLGEARSDGAVLALAAWHKWGADCCNELIGEFAMAIYDPRDRSLFALRDAMGVRPLYFAAEEGGITVATSIPPLRALTTRAFDLDPAWLARYALFTSMSHSTTPFTGIVKVPPGHILRLRGGQVELRRYHYFDLTAPPGDRHDEAWVEAYREVLEEAVRCRLDSADPIGIEISGGLDTSTIVGFAPRMLEDPDRMLHGFGFVFFEAEPDAILGASRFAGVRNNHIFTNSDPADELRQRGLDVLGHPAEHGNALVHMPFYKLAGQLGVSTLLSGFGGDEGVTNHARNHRRDLIGSGQYKALWQVLKGNPAAKALRFAKSLYNHRSYPEYAPGYVETARKRLAGNFLTDEVSREINLHQEVLDAARVHCGHDTLNAFCVDALAAPFVATRTESCSLVAASYGIEYSWPLLDVRLIQQWLATPTVEKVSAEMGRYLHRRALRGVVPDAVRLRARKSMGPPLSAAALPGQSAIPDANATWDWLGELRDGLHPRIAPMVDRDRLARCIDDVETSPERNPATILHIRSLRCLHTLDFWLRQMDDRKSA